MVKRLTSEKNRMDKKTEILNAAAECFAVYGYEKTSMSDIGKRVGMNKASLYYHFKDKQDLYSTMVRRKRTAYIAGIEAKLRETEPGIARVVLFLVSEIDFIEDLAVNFLVSPSYGEGGKDDSLPVYNDLIQEDISRITQMLQPLEKQGKLTQCDPGNMAGIILKISRALLLADCPLDVPKNQRAAAYERVRSEIRTVIPLVINGACT